MSNLQNKIHVSVNHLGYVFTNLTIDGLKRRRRVIESSESESSDSEPEIFQIRRTVKSPNFNEILGSSESESSDSQSSEDSDDESQTSDNSDNLNIAQVRQKYTREFVKDLKSKQESNPFLKKLFEIYNRVNQKGFFERAISRMLHFSHALRHQIGHTQFIHYLVADSQVGHFRVPENSQNVDWNWHNLNQGNEDKYYVKVRISDTAHAVVLFKQNETWYLFDPNGRESAFAKLVQDEGQEKAQINIEILDTKNVHTKCFDTDLFRKGMTLSRSKGWCSLWALFVLHLLSLQCSKDEIVRFVQNLYFEGDDFSYILIALRNSVVNFYRKCCELFIDPDNKILKSWQNVLLERMKFESPNMYEMWKDIFQKSPKDSTSFTANNENENLVYAIKKPSGNNEDDFAEVRIGAQKWNIKHKVGKMGVYIRFKVTHEMTNYRIGLYIRYTKKKLSLWQQIENILNMKTKFQLSEIKIEDFRLYTSKSKYTERDVERIDTSLELLRDSKKIYDSVNFTGNLLEPLKSEENNEITLKYNDYYQLENSDLEKKMKRIMHKKPFRFIFTQKPEVFHFGKEKEDSKNVKIDIVRVDSNGGKPTVPFTGFQLSFQITDKANFKDVKSLLKISPRMNNIYEIFEKGNWLEISHLVYKQNEDNMTIKNYHENTTLIALIDFLVLETSMYTF